MQWPMKWTVALLGVVALVLTLATPGPAAVAVITASAPLEDESDEAVQAALDRAVDEAVDEAMQMGLRPVRLENAEIWRDRVVVQVLATDRQRDEGDSGLPLRPGERLALGPSDRP